MNIKNNDRLKMDIEYFMCPNEILDKSEELGLKSQGILVYIYLVRCANNSTAFPSMNTIAQKTQLSRSTVIRTIEDLIKKDLIIKHKRFNTRKNEYESNIYEILSPKKILSRIDIPTVPTIGSITETPPSFTEIPSSFTETPPSFTETPYKQLVKTTNYKELYNNNNRDYVNQKEAEKPLENSVVVKKEMDKSFSVKQDNISKNINTPLFKKEVTVTNDTSVVIDIQHKELINSLKENISNTLEIDQKEIKLPSLKKIIKNNNVSMDKINYYLDNWTKFSEFSNINEPINWLFGALKVKELYQVPTKKIKKNNDIPQEHNFDQRKYTNKDYRGMYSNITAEQMETLEYMEREDYSYDNE
jgi:hypothetical protein